MPLSLKTIEKTFLLFRQIIYESSIKEMVRLSGQLELDETMFGGKKSGKRGWGAEGKMIVFGIYKREYHLLQDLLSTVLKDFGVMPKTGYIIIGVYPKNIFSYT